METTYHCIECQKVISSGINEFSMLIYGHPLCISHQNFISESGATEKAVDLYFALKARKLPVVLEHFDGQKHVDIALPGKLNIEVTDVFNYKTMQAMTDLRRMVSSLEQNIPTVAISKYLLDDPKRFALTVETLARLLSTMVQRSVSYELASSLTPIQLQ